MIIYGTRKFGWVDEVEGLGTVATTFIHLMFVPLIPIGTHLMIDDERGIPLPMSLKSIVVAWVRSVVFWTAFVCWVMVPTTFGISCVLALPATLAWFVMPALLRRASPERADELRAYVAAL